MTAERFRMDTISMNIANANSVQTDGKPAFRRKIVELTGTEDGVKVTRIRDDQSDLRRVLDRGNPLADKDGYVTYSNVEPISEMVNMMGASRAYEANIAAFNSAKGMMRAALDIGRA